MRRVFMYAFILGFIIVVTGAGAAPRSIVGTKLYLDTNKDGDYTTFTETNIARLDANQTVSGDWEINGDMEFHTQDHDYPFSVHPDDTGLVSNLNADRLDSHEGSYYLDLANATGNLSTDRYSAKADLKAELSPATSDALVYNGSDYVSRSFAELGMNPGNIVTVDCDGGADYTDISSAITAASAGDVVYIYPGTYTVTSYIHLNKAVTLLGVSMDECIVQRDHYTENVMAGTDAVIYSSAAGANIENLTVQNIGDGTGSGITPTIITGQSSSGYIRNCYLRGNGGRDIFILYSSSSYVCDNVTVEQYKAGSDASHPIWVANDATLEYIGGKVSVLGTGGGIQTNTTGDVSFYFTQFDTGDYIVDSDACGDLRFMGCYMDATTILDSGTYNNYYLYYNSQGDIDISDNVTIDGSLAVKNGSNFGDSTTTGESYIQMLTSGGIVFGITTGGIPTVDVNLYRSAADVLKTDDTFEFADTPSLTVTGSGSISEGLSVGSASVPYAPAYGIGSEGDVSTSACVNCASGYYVGRTEVISSGREGALESVTLPDEGWIGLGSDKGRMIFDDAANDAVNIKGLISMAMWGTATGNNNYAYWLFKESDGTARGAIGDTSSGDSHITLLAYNGNNVILDPNGGGDVVCTGDVLPSSDNAVSCGANGARWTAVWAANGTIQSSDLRLKDIEGPSPGLDLIKDLAPIEYTWKDDLATTSGKRLHYGLGAQEVEAAMSFHGKKKTGVVYGGAALNYAELVPVLIKAVQEQQEQIEALEARIEKLERAKIK